MGQYITNECESHHHINLKPKWLSPGMKDYFVSSKFKEDHKGDLLLYDAVNKSLDLTIERLGRENVQRNLEKYSNLMKLSKSGCGINDFYNPKFFYSDVEETPTFERLSEEEQNLVRNWTH